MTLRAFVRVVLAASAAAILASCHGGGGSSALPASQTLGGAVQPYKGSAALTFTWGSGVLTGATYLGPATIPGTMFLNVQPQLQNEQGLLDYAQSTGDPHSANYRHWLTPEEIGARYGASASAIAAAAKYFESYHLNVGTWPQHLLMAVNGTQANVEAAFGTKFGIWQIETPTGPVQVYGPQPSAAPHFATAIPVATVMSLVGFHPAHTYIERPADVQGYGYAAGIIRNGFDYTGLIASGHSGQGINIGIIGTGPISTGSSGDVAGYAQLSGLCSTCVATVVQKDVTAQTGDSAWCPSGPSGNDCEEPDPGGLATPPPVTAPCSSTVDPAGAAFVTTDPACNEEDGEAQLDTEMTSGMAPGATVDFYLAYNPEDCAPQYFDCASGWTGTGTPTGIEGIYLTDDEIQQAIADNLVDVLSLSYGEGEAYGLGFYYNSNGTGPGPDEFAALAAEGVTTFVSSGDNGAYSCDSGGSAYGSKCASYPASDPSVIGVGGVNAPFTNAGQIQPGTQITAWASNTTYGGDGYDDNSSGSGGGVSLYFKAPSWQATSKIGATMREIPDIALLADPKTGPMLVMNWAFSGYQAYGASGGTSAAAPLSAAMFADFLSECKTNATCSKETSGTHGYRWGLAAAQAFYAIAEEEANFGAQAECAGGSSGAFYDVCAGSNDTNTGGDNQTGYPATPGYNEVTGLGVPFGGYLTNELFGYCGCGTLNLP